MSEVYKLTNELPKSETYGLTSQMRRALISIISNLSEGASQKSNIEKKRFFEYQDCLLMNWIHRLKYQSIWNYYSTKRLNFLRYLLMRFLLCYQI